MHWFDQYETRDSRNHNSTLAGIKYYTLKNGYCKQKL